MATVREAGEIARLYREAHGKYFPDRPLLRDFGAGELVLFGKAHDVATRFGRPPGVYIEAAYVYYLHIGELRPPRLLELAGERLMRRIFAERISCVWEPSRERRSGEDWERRIAEILTSRRWWDLTTIPAARLVESALFVEMLGDTDQPFGIWQAAVLRHLETEADAEEKGGLDRK